MTDAFLALARSQYASQQHVDPDIQVALGVLYFMIGNFQEAKGCWQAALEERPEVRARLGRCRC
jgi:peroxin-5